MLCLGVAVALAVGAFSRHRVGGITGDVIGAACELAQVTALLGEASIGAVRVLREGLEAAKDADRQRAATSILGSLLRMRVGPEIDQEIETLREELAELRRNINEENQQ